MKRILGIVIAVAVIVSAMSSAVLVSAAADKQIAKIEISGVVDAAVGNVPETEMVAVGDKAGYEIAKLYWQDNTAKTTKFDTFCDMHKYTLNIQLKALEGYTFDNSPAVFVNGEETEGQNYPRYDDYVYITLDYSFLKKIEKIELPAFPEKVPVGEKYTPVLDTATERLVSENEYYAISSWLTWFEEGAESRFGNIGGELKDGNLYLCEYKVFANEGYEITDETEITVGGKKLPYSIYNAVGDTEAAVYKTYNLSKMKPISVFELSVAKPTIDNAVDKKYSFDTVGVRVVDFVIDDSANKKLIDREELGVIELTNRESSGTYSADRYYAAKGIIKAASGYFFADDMKVKVNGAEADIFRYLGNEMQGKWAPHEFACFMMYFGKPEEKVAVSEPSVDTSSEEPTEDRPGDAVVNTDPEVNRSMPLPIIIAVSAALLICAGIVIFIILYRRKKKNKEE